MFEAETSMLPRWPCAVCLVAPLACADGGGADEPTAPGGTMSQTGPQTAGGTDGTSPGETEGEDASTSSGSETDAMASSSSTGAGELELDVEVVTHPRQPMVVDLRFSQPALAVLVSNPLDAGVRAGVVEGDDDETRVRVRGLAPATVHALAWDAEDSQGRTATGEVEFSTLPPQPGFVPSFAVRGDPTGLEGLLLFDVVGISETAPSSLFAVDTSGTARWHVGQTNAALDPSIVYAAAKLRDDGSVIFLRDYAITALDELGEEVFSLDSAAIGVPGLHHDFEILPNGNLLTMSYVFREVDDAELGPIYVAADLLLEVTPEGETVWSWDMFDHLDIDRRPPGFDEQVYDPVSGAFGYDWTHSNGLLYEPDTDSVIVSIRHQDWLVRVDRQSDEIAWRFGADGDFSLVEGSWPYHQHSPQWQPDGSLLLYDNGLHNPDVDDAQETSRAVRYVLDEDAMTATQVWEDGRGALVPIAGDADRLADGSVLVTDSSIDFAIGMSYAEIRKVDEAEPEVSQWSLRTELGTFVYRCLEIPRLVGKRM